jgi:DNA polymerase-1
MSTSAVGDLQVMLVADGSQIELRALAELSGDKLLIRQFQEAALDRHNPLKDVHCQVGHTLTGWPVERIASEKKTRRMVKELHFGIVFGLNEHNVYSSVVTRIRARDGANADLTGITKPRMVQLYRNYFKKYPGVKTYQDSRRNFAEKQGYAETLFGFRREIKQNDSSRGSFWANQAINSPVQGTAHQFLLIAMALLHLKPRTYSLLQKCIMEVHDALYFLVKLRDLPGAYMQLMHLFEIGAWSYAQQQFGLKLQVPLLAEAEAGFCMGSMVGYNGETVKEFLQEWRKKQQETENKSWEDLMPSAA